MPNDFGSKILRCAEDDMLGGGRRPCFAKASQDKQAPAQPKAFLPTRVPTGGACYGEASAVELPKQPTREVVADAAGVGRFRA